LIHERHRKLLKISGSWTSLIGSTGKILKPREIPARCRQDSKLCIFPASRLVLLKESRRERAELYQKTGVVTGVAHPVSGI
jgi:hypothetical protein